jgi:Papain-like cysteine protease AvrRpt2
MPQNPLPFNIQTQECSEWCWAAVVSSIAAFVNTIQPPQQCEIVDRDAFSPHDPSPGCCDGSNRCVPKNSGCICNRTGSIGDALQDYALVTNGSAGQVPSANDFTTIAQQIDQSCTVVIQVVDQANSFLAHVMVVFGYSGTDTLMVGDPADGSATQYSYSELLNPPATAGHSTWRLSQFFTTVPGPS